jgi:hypothetical protein
LLPTDALSVAVASSRAIAVVAAIAVVPAVAALRVVGLPGADRLGDAALALAD